MGAEGTCCREHKGKEGVVSTGYMVLTCFENLKIRSWLVLPWCGPEVGCVHTTMPPLNRFQPPSKTHVPTVQELALSIKDSSIYHPMPTNEMFFYDSNATFPCVGVGGKGKGVREEPWINIHIWHP